MTIEDEERPGDLAVVWQVRPGHWRADLYRDTTPEEQRLSGRSPDSFLTRNTEHGARLAAAFSWPDAHQIVAEEEDQ